MGCHCFDAEQSITLSHSPSEVQSQVVYIHVKCTNENIIEHVVLATDNDKFVDTETINSEEPIHQHV